MKRKAPIDDGEQTSFTPSKQARLASSSQSHRLPGCVLFRNEAETVFVVDIPRSLEDAQVLPGGDRETPLQSGKRRRRIYSTPPVSQPFVLPEPKDAAAMQMALAPSALLQDLMTGATVKAALDELATDYGGPMCLPRIHKPAPAPKTSGSLDTKELSADEDATSSSSHHIPPDSHPLHGTIASILPSATNTIPPSSLDLIILDPPWPNASARRNKSSSPYATCGTMPDTARLLSSIPVASWLAPGGLVAIWLTNKHTILPMLTGSARHGPGDIGGGVFAAWGVELAAEWVWVKVTDGGEPIFDVDGFYRKPWERLLIARRKGGFERTTGHEDTTKRDVTTLATKLKTRVVVAVPDVHSRKPNLRPLFEDILPPDYKAMEIFARNLTAGWWSWGDDVLKFQASEWWTDGGGIDDKDVEFTLPLR